MINSKQEQIQMRKNKKDQRTQPRLSLRHSDEGPGIKFDEYCVGKLGSTSKCQKMIFKERENEMEENMRLLEQQNQLMERLGTLKSKQSCKELIPASSIKVLEELDLNKKQAHKALELENRNLLNRIEELELTLEGLEKHERSITLCPEYMAKLEEKIRKREKLRKLMSERVQTELEELEKVKGSLKQIYGEQGQAAVCYLAE